MTIELEGFGVAFGTRVVLADISTTFVGRGGAEVLMGPVKTGKSTLLRSLAGLNDSNADFRCWGSASIDGHAIAGANRPTLVQQRRRLLASSVMDAVVDVAKRSGDLGARSAAQWADFAEAHLQSWEAATLVPPQFWRQVLVDLPDTAQRAANILAHLASGKSWLFVDEPTYGLDDRDAMRLIDWLKRVAARQRTLVTLHNLQQARALAENITLIGGGRVLAACPVERFFALRGNVWVDQFLRSGSLAIASPDSQPDELEPDCPPPPPLPPGAVAAVKAAEAAKAARHQPPAYANVSDPGSTDRRLAIQATEAPPLLADPSVSLELAHPEPQQETNTDVSSPAIAAGEGSHSDPTPAPVSGTGLDATPKSVARASPPPQSPASPAGRRQARLPSLSVRGVEDAAGVGRVIASEYCGPAGFHWILPGQLAGCAEPGVSAPLDYDLDLLGRVGVTWLLTLTETDLDQDALRAAKLRNLHVPVPDREAPTILQAYMLARRIQLFLDQGDVLAVHCKAGIGRTGTVLAAWMIREGGLTAAESIARLRRINPMYVQSEEQERFLKAFESDILQRM